MIHFDNRPWQMASFFDKCAGYWPFQSCVRKSLILTFHFLIIISAIVSLGSSWYKSIGVDYIICFQCVISLIFIIGNFSKPIVISANQKSRRRIYEIIRRHFSEIVDEEEATVLRNFSDRGWKYFTIYTTVGLVIAFIFIAIPVLRTAHNYYFGDGQLIVKLPFEFDYGVNINEHLFPIFLHFSLFIGTTAAITFAFDLSFFLQVHHACALIKIVTMRLKKCASMFNQSEAESKTEQDPEVEAHFLLKKAMQLHIESFELISLIESGHSSCFFFLLLCNTAIFAVIIHLISVMTDDYLESVRNVLAFFVLLMHFFVMFSQGQSIIDHTSKVFDACYDCRWYDTSKKMRSMWLIIMIRSLEPCVITGAKCFILSFETYSNMLKAGVSYYTVFEN